ncbi:precorrin-6y C5,15-methyltransferase (decarboxylating) subunit CbiE [Amycolatopsis sp. NPDC004368]
MQDTAPITVVGIGADGWTGLGEKARNAVLEADIVLGAPRQLTMLPDDIRTQAWPSPLLPALDDVLAAHAGRRICVLASGDPLLSGIATTLRDRGHAIDVLPALSSVTLARARLGWSFEETEVVTVVGRAIQRVARALAPRRKLLVLGANAHDLRELLHARGYADSTLTSLENLGADDEHITDAWIHDPGPLSVFALICAGPALPLTGLPDDAFEHDGQLTKRDLRASALAHLAPVPGELLWDIGAGAGSIGIEWSRAHPLNRAVAIERDPVRAERITRNAATLGVPELQVVTGSAPDVLAGLPEPDAIFIGGGLTVPGVLDTCVATGARVVAHGVTLEAEQILAAAYTSRGGELTRIAVDHARPLGGFTGWTPSRTVTSWSSR